MKNTQRKINVSIFIASMVCLINLIGTPAIAQKNEHADEIDAMRYKWKQFLVGENADISDSNVVSEIEALNKQAQYHWKQLRKDSSVTQLWPDLKYIYSKDITTSFHRLSLMALAYSTQSGKLYHSAQLKNDILNTMEWLYQRHYNEKTPLPIPKEGSDIHNWWDYKIGVPLEINNIVIMLYDEMSSAQRNRYMNAINHFTPDFVDAYTRKPAVTEFTAANRVWVSTVICLRGIILKDSARIAFASRSLLPVFDYTKTEDGFYQDGSFIQHVKHPYTGGYGISLLSRLTEEIYLLSGSKWELKEESAQNIYKWIYHSFEPVVYKGNVMPIVEGREISRRDAEGDKKGILVTEAVALLSKAASPAEAAHIHKIITSWYDTNQLKQDFFAGMPISYIKIIKNLFKQNTPSTPSLEYSYKQFPHMDRVVQKAPGYAFAVSMHSSRIFNYETRTNYENIKGWHTSDGQTYLFNNDLDQFNDNFWATVNYYHLPGTTVEDQTQVPGFKNSKNNWVGGVNLLNKYGVTGMDLATTGQTLTAKKSWFLLDGKIVALGAGITNEDGAEVNTYIEQRKLPEKDTSTFIIDGEVMPQNFGGNGQPPVHKDALWAYLSGIAPGDGIGYYFPGTTALNATKNKQSGSWQDVNLNQNNKVYTRTYLTLWKNHGNEKNDSNGDKNKYAYVLLPARTITETKAYALKPDVFILENTAKIQAVKSAGLNLIAANFWGNKTTSLNADSIPAYLTCNTQAAVIIQKEKDTLRIAVADPTMVGTGIIITLKEKTTGVISTDSAIKVLSVGKLTKFAVHVVQSEGQTFNVTFSTK